MFHYLNWQEYHDANDAGLLQAGDGATTIIDDVLFEQLTHIEDDTAVVWVAWDDHERSGMQSYVSQQDAYRRGLWR